MQKANQANTEKQKIKWTDKEMQEVNIKIKAKASKKYFISIINRKNRDNRE